MSAVLESNGALAHARWVGHTFTEALRLGVTAPMVGEKRLTAQDYLVGDLSGAEEREFADAAAKIIRGEFDAGCAAFLRFVALATKRVETNAFEGFQP